MKTLQISPPHDYARREVTLNFYLRPVSKSLQLSLKQMQTKQIRHE